MTLLMLLAGFVALFFGGELFVRGSAALALRLGVSSLFIGLTIVAFGTSSPELFVSLKAAYLGYDNMAVANVIGSNFINIGIIGGLSLLVRPVAVHRGLRKLDAPVMLIGCFLLTLVAQTGKIACWQGIVFTLAAIAYTGMALYYGKRHPSEEPSLEDISDELGISKKWGCALDWGQSLLGLLLLLLGTHWVVESAISIANAWGVRPALIGLTLVAGGTSLPELAICMVAAYRKHGDLALGNVVGSTIFNTFAIIGLTAMVTPIEIRELGVIDFFAMLLVSCVFVLMIFRLNTMGRREGVLLLLISALYYSYLILQILAVDTGPVLLLEQLKPSLFF